MGGGSCVLEIQTGGWGASRNPSGGGGGVKNGPICWGGVDFFWNNPKRKIVNIA